ncbi:MAG: metal-binding protein, partial [Deltaproteobacteria bacterium DG_8]
MSDNKDPACSTCPVQERICLQEKGKGPQSCPTINMGEAIESALKRYDDPEIARFARAASIQEAECYFDRHTRPFKVLPIKTRVEEIAEFAERMGYKRLGLAFCGGVMSEASILTSILKNYGFEVISVVCKVGRVPKERIGLRAGEKILKDQFEVMCNPIAQAEVLNQACTDFNIMMGLCVGHDALFLKQ